MTDTTQTTDTATTQMEAAARNGAEASAQRPAALATAAIHAGQEPDPTTGAVVTPLYLTSTFKQDGVGGLRNGYEYSRSGNPTRDAFDAQLAAVEGGAHALSFSSGLAAIDVLLRSTLKPGASVLLGNDVYGGTYRLMHQVFAPWGVTVDVVDVTDQAAVSEALGRHSYDYLWVETPSNPLLRVTDIAFTAAAAHAQGTKVVVDNTFASPALQHPLASGADIVVYSTTKYIGGHSDTVGGAIVLNDEETYTKIAFLQNAAGAVPGPFDSWLAIRGLKTLEVRVQRHSANALAVARYLADNPAIERVFYPGLESDEGHEIAARQMHGGFGGVVSATLKAGEQAARGFVGATRLFTLAESLGGVESLIEHPASMTHSSVAGTALAVPSNLVRLSVGIENVEDLIADLEKAFIAISR